MILGILKELNDNRVSLIPDIAGKFVNQECKVWVESQAGINAFYSDEDFTGSGCEIRTRDEVLSQSDLLLSIHPVSKEELDRLKKETTYVSSFQPFADGNTLSHLISSGITALSLDMIPRTTMAQTMDVLSSMASISGYKAVLLAAGHLPRYFPMLTTAAGSIPPAKVLVLGAGVAGLQAIATARRLGAVVEAFDTRLAAKEEVESLGARFVEVEGSRDEKSAGGYAVEQTEEYKRKQKEMIHEKVIRSDVVISTALLRGKPAPLLITKEMVNEMKPGSVIVDLAAITGGNCELTKPGEIIHAGKVTIIGIREVSATVPSHASQLYSRNIQNYLQLFLNNGKMELNFENEIVRSSCIVLKGENRYNK